MNDNFESLSHGPISSLEEVDENEAFSTESKPTLLHHEQLLHDYFGAEVADSFLHPVMDTSVGVAGMSASISSHKKNKSSNKKRINITYDQALSKLTSNAERLWKILRENSIYNIEKEDKRIPEDLKMSFDSFARSCINRNMTPPERSFVENNELKEMEKIVKNRKIEKSDLARRKKQLMFNLSRVQEGNQKILMREKSFLGDTDMGFGTKELFFPPILDGVPDHFSVHKDIEHRKPHEKSYHKMLADLEVEVVNEDALFQSNSKPSYPGLRFFTEQDSHKVLKSKREFMSNLDSKSKDMLMENIIDKSRRWAEDDRIRSGASFEYVVPSKGKIERSKSQKDLSKMKPENVKQWQPLTLGAVMDFKIAKKPTFLDEHTQFFRQGSVKLWRPKLTQV